MLGKAESYKAEENQASLTLESFGFLFFQTGARMISLFLVLLFC